MESLRLYFLGPPRIEQAGQPVTVDTRKATALLAYLALSGESQTRDALAALLWPEFDDRRAKAALRRTLSALKAATGEAPLRIARESLGLEETAVWCDVWHFRALLSGDPAPAALQTAVDLYRDDFLAGFSLRDSIPFDDWQVWQAEHLRRDLDQALVRLLASLSADGAYAAALPLAHRRLALDNLREDAHRTLMQLYAWAGQPNAALRQYRDCVRILDEELGVPPLPETTALYEAILNERLSAPTAQVSATPPSPTGPPVVTTVLIGREPELAQMATVYGRVAPDSHLLSLTGEAGIGKTYLAEQFLEAARRQGATILAARCYAGETQLAYAALIQLLREGLAQGTAREKLAALDPAALAETARLLPELAHLLPATRPPADPGAPGAQSRFYDGVGQVLAALLDGPQPGILWIDDAHWLDTASLELLLFWLRRRRARPFLALLSWRTADLFENDSLGLALAEMQRAGRATEISLQRFTEDEVGQMVAASGRSFPADLPARLYEETEGLPYFLTAYLADLNQRSAPPAQADAWHIPRSVRDLLHARIAPLAGAERQLVQTAAVSGQAFPVDLLQVTSGRSEEETVSALEKLVARGVLVEKGSLYDFSHEKLRDLAYEETSLARRRLLHRRLAEVLSQRAERARQPAAAAGQIAQHYHLAGRDEEAAAYFRQAGDFARGLYAHREALGHYQMALALGAAETAVLHEACGDVHTRLGEYTAALRQFETAAALSRGTHLGRLEHKLALVYQRLGAWALAEQKLAQARENYGDDVEPGALARLYSDGSLIAQRLDKPEEAQLLAQQALDLAAHTGDAAALAQAHNRLGLLARSAGDLGGAVQHARESLRLAAVAQQLDAQVAAGNNLALALGMAHEQHEAEQHLREALALCRTGGDRHQEAALRSNLADLLHQAGDEAGAMAQMKEAAAILGEIGGEQESWQAEIWKLTEW